MEGNLNNKKTSILTRISFTLLTVYLIFKGPSKVLIFIIMGLILTVIWGSYFISVKRKKNFKENIIPDIECNQLISECLNKHGEQVPDNLGLPSMSIIDLERCLDCVLKSFCEEGLDENSEPNPYGLKLERVIDYLNRISFFMIKIKGGKT